LRADVARESGRANTLQTQNNTLQTDLARETGRANSLQTTLDTRDATIRTQTATIANRNDVIEQIRNVIEGTNLADMGYNQQVESVSRMQRALQLLN
jgi:hypothetical protein